MSTEWFNNPDNAPIDLERALWLKGKGFKKKTYFYYQLEDLPYSAKGLKFDSKPINHNKYNHVVSMPNKSQYEEFMKQNDLKYNVSYLPSIILDEFCPIGK